jgi:hypothetical protein
VQRIGILEQRQGMWKYYSDSSVYRACWDGLIKATASELSNGSGEAEAKRVCWG